MVKLRSLENGSNIDLKKKEIKNKSPSLNFLLKIKELIDIFFI